MLRPSPNSTLFPYTTLFRSADHRAISGEDDRGLGRDDDLPRFDLLRQEAGGDCKEKDRKSTRLNSSHGYISYAVFCLKKKMRHDVARVVDDLLEITQRHPDH